MGTIFGAINVETPRYTVLKQGKGYEIRQYESQLRAEYVMPHSTPPGILAGQNTAFQKLAGYIFGKNESREQSTASSRIAMTAPVVTNTHIAMTAPVVTSTGDQTDPSSPPVETQKSMAFILPSSFKSVEELPKPKDADVNLKEVPGHKVAATTFSGWLTDGLAHQKEQVLRKACEADGIKLSEDRKDVQYCQYNPPWTLPFLRKNEILVLIMDQ